jgi:hypothetical protein
MTEAKRKNRKRTRREKPVISEGEPITKKLGRPPTGVGVLIGVRVQPDDLATLDTWRAAEPDAPSRPEAIRRLVNIALKWRVPKK